MACALSLPPLCQGKRQTCHLKCMNTLCNTQQRSSPTPWRYPPLGAQWLAFMGRVTVLHSITGLVTGREARGLNEARLFPALIQAGAWTQGEESPGSRFQARASKGEITALIQCLSYTSTNPLIQTTAALPSPASQSARTAPPRPQHP